MSKKADNSIGETQFDEAYARSQPAYGRQASSPLVVFLGQTGHQGIAWDLGAGAGRDTMAIARAGYHVHCFDRSEKGLQRIRQQAMESELEDRIKATRADIRELEFSRDSLGLIVATTVLDHIPAADSRKVFRELTGALNDHGVIYVEVHTTDDPGCKDCPPQFRSAPVSETASAVVNYFEPNRLAEWAVHDESQLRILHYEERLEWDTTHGPHHLHGKAILLAERRGAHRLWRGELPAGEAAQPV